MKFFCSFLVMALFVSCGGGQKLLQRTTIDGGKILVKKDFFSGIDYIYIEKRFGGKVKYKLFYDCECGINNKISLRKDFVDETGKMTAWKAVTDTTGLDRQHVQFFGVKTLENSLSLPIEFMAITNEEVDILQEGLNKVSKECCKNPEKPFIKILGFVKLKLN